MSDGKVDIDYAAEIQKIESEQNHIEAALDASGFSNNQWALIKEYIAGEIRLHAYIAAKAQTDYCNEASKSLDRAI